MYFCYRSSSSQPSHFSVCVSCLAFVMTTNYNCYCIKSSCYWYPLSYEPNGISRWTILALSQYVAVNRQTKRSICSCLNDISFSRSHPYLLKLTQADGHPRSSKDLKICSLLRFPSIQYFSFSLKNPYSFIFYSMVMVSKKRCSFSLVNNPTDCEELSLQDIFIVGVLHKDSSSTHYRHVCHSVSWHVHSPYALLV